MIEIVTRVHIWQKLLEIMEIIRIIYSYEFIKFAYQTVHAMHRIC